MFLVALAVLIGIASASPVDWVQLKGDPSFHKFAQYASDFNKTYSVHEKAKRFQYFKENMDRAAALNELHNGSATFGPTIFSDLSQEEFAQTYLSSTYEQSYSSIPIVNVSGPYGPTPTAFDWQKLGCVTEVRNQGTCGSCWAFTAVAEMESQVMIKATSRGTVNVQVPLRLSPQQLVDCDPFSNGCQGGSFLKSVKYVYQAGGLSSESSYPYKGTRTACKGAVSPQIRLSTETAIRCGTTPSEMYDFVYNHGPAACSLDATPLQNYRGGIINLDSSVCGNINHLTLIAGYDQVNNFLRVRNSWGTSWGENGYFRMTATSCMINKFVMGSSLA